MLGKNKFSTKDYFFFIACVHHVGAGEFTIHFSPGDQGLHLPSLAKKGNAPLMPERGAGEGLNDWCIRNNKMYA